MTFGRLLTVLPPRSKPSISGRCRSQFGENASVNPSSWNHARCASTRSQDVERHDHQQTHSHVDAPSQVPGPTLVTPRYFQRARRELKKARPNRKSFDASKPDVRSGTPSQGAPRKPKNEAESKSDTATKRNARFGRKTKSALASALRRPISRSQSAPESNPRVIRSGSLIASSTGRFYHWRDVLAGNYYQPPVGLPSWQWPLPSCVWEHALAWTLANQSPSGFCAFFNRTSALTKVSTKGVLLLLEAATTLSAPSSVNGTNKDVIGLVVSVFSDSSFMDSAKEYPLTARALGVFLQHASREQVRSFSRHVLLSEATTHHLMFGHVSRQLAYNGDVQLATDVLIKAWQRGLLRGDLNRHSALILKRCTNLVQGYRTCLDIFEQLVQQVGLISSSQICNIVMLNAARAGDHSMVLSIARTMTQNGLGHTDHSRGILLKSLRKARDVAVVQEIVQGIIKDADAIRSPQLALEILCALRDCNAWDKQDLYRRVGVVFSSLFDPRPLRRLGLVPADLPLWPQEQASNLLPAPLQAITVVVDLYCEQTHLRPQDLIDLFNRLGRFISNDPRYKALLKSDHIWCPLIYRCALSFGDYGTAFTMMIALLADAEPTISTHAQETIPWPDLHSLPVKTSRAISARTWTLIVEAMLLRHTRSNRFTQEAGLSHTIDHLLGFMFANEIEVTFCPAVVKMLTTLPEHILLPTADCYGLVHFRRALEQVGRHVGLDA